MQDFEQSSLERSAAHGSNSSSGLSHRALHQSQDLHEAIFNESTDALFLVDSTTLRTVDCNHRAVELFEASSKDELIDIEGPTLHRYPLTPEQRQLIVKNMRSGVWIGEIEYVTRRGNFFWGNLAAKSIQIGDRLIHLIRITDITQQQIALLERQQAEIERERLLEQEKAARAVAEQANRAKDEFLAVLSHELRSPLNPILGWTKLLQGRKFEKDKVQQALATIERNAKLLVQLIDDLLDMARIMQGKLVLNCEPVSLPDVIGAAVETVRFAAESKLVELKVLLIANPQSVEGDAMRLQQVIWNLLSNAVKFTPASGKVIVRLEQDNTHAQIQIEDTGKGISPEFLPHIFEQFQQQDTSTARQFGGLGLGLAISRQLVELHGGTITAQSLGEGKGATFTVRLPLMYVSAQSTLPAPATIQTTDLKNVRVLAVDDELDSLELIKVLLEQEGMVVTTVTSAEQAINTLTQAQFDVLISDIGMPGIDGYSLLHQIRRLSTKQRQMQRQIMPAIALTAYVGEYNQKQALDAGYHIHLSKPIEPGVLIAAIATLIRRS